jgi:alkanesulfonate monooxygenase SsuD/methylene tetrahydromethanopterin reductase-like flavin-dependent oxidoreductase (luciferase family)
MLDVMSGGRLIAGMIRGVPHEYIAYNVSPDESRERLREAHALIIKAWTEAEPFRWEGRFYQYPCISIWPRPFQRPHPPVLMSASNEESAAFAAEHRAMMGMTLIADLSAARRCVETYRRTAQAVGFEVTPEHILIGQNTCIAESDEEARAHLAAGLRYYHQILMAPIREAQRRIIEGSSFFGDEEQGRGHIKRLSTLGQRSVEELIEAGSVLCGSPQTVLKQMARIRSELGNGRFNINMKIGNIPDHVVRRGMELFRDRVLPEAALL